MLQNFLIRRYTEYGRKKLPDLGEGIASDVERVQ